ncbi:MAG: endonuclease/exonuclease/phosphatase family protein [Alloprevotella sp.]|nr:endonuclease/exonuclease/phosphatase family protein [Alloprevotella sp.]
MLRSVLLLVAFVWGISLQAQRAAVYAVAFYNVENLFDIVDDPDNPGDDEFLPTGPYQWTQEKYEQKLDNIAKVISELARETCPAGPAIIGISEIENRKVVEDLLERPAIRNMGLKLIHYDSPDRRGIDVGLIYNPRLFTLDHAFPHPTIFPGKDYFKTRDILEVTGTLAGEPFTVLVNHWPSRYGGGKSAPNRNNSARIVRELCDSMRAADPARKIVVMGDLNDDPKDDSCAKVLGATRKQKGTPFEGYFNATWPLYDAGICTLWYQDVACLYDQQIISANLLPKHTKGLRFWKAEVFNPPYLLQQTGKNKGYPKRSFVNSNWQNGFSDHLPTITYFIKDIK